jgi:iron complex outermembrane receptor protein
LSDFVPGLTISRANVGAVPYLRGVGNFTATPGNEAAIATYIDDVYYPAGGSSNYEFNNIARIEVLKGPQGTLFGRNAAGGVISLITKDPTATPTLDLSAGYANYDTYTGSLYGSTAITDNLSADIAINAMQQEEGWGKNLFDGSKAYIAYDSSFRSKWLWTPDTATRVVFIANLDHERNDQGSASNLIPGTTSLGGYHHFGGFYDVDTNFDGFGETINYGASLNASRELSWAGIKSISAWHEAHWKGVIENDSSPADIQEARLNSLDKTASQEFQVYSLPDSRITWIGGAYLYLDDSSEWPFTQYGNVAATRPGRQQLTYSNQQTFSYAIYGQATATVLDATHLTLGLRYTDDNRHIVGHQQDINGVLISAGNQSTEAGAVTYRVALDHQFDDNVMGYVSYNRGFKSGNYNANTPAGAPTKPEFLDAYETGLKSNLFGDTVRLNGAVYYYEFHDLQVQQQLITGTLQTNAARAEYYGLDLDGEAILTPSFNIQAAVNLENADYTSYPNAIFNFPATNGLGYTQRTVNASGYDVPYADKFTASVNANYTFLDAFTYMLGVAHHNGYNFDTQGLVRQPAYWMVNTSLSWVSSDSTWGVKLWADNLFDQEWFAQKQVSNAGETYSPGAPRTFGITLSRHI